MEAMFVNTAMEDEEGGPPAEPIRRKAATEATILISKKSATRMKRVSIDSPQKHTDRKTEI